MICDICHELIIVTVKGRESIAQCGCGVFVIRLDLARKLLEK